MPSNVKIIKNQKPKVVLKVVNGKVNSSSIVDSSVITKNDLEWQDIYGVLSIVQQRENLPLQHTAYINEENNQAEDEDSDNNESEHQGVEEWDPRSFAEDAGADLFIEVEEGSIENDDLDIVEEQQVAESNYLIDQYRQFFGKQPIMVASTELNFGILNSDFNLDEEKNKAAAYVVKHARWLNRKYLDLTVNKLVNQIRWWLNYLGKKRDMKDVSTRYMNDLRDAVFVEFDELFIGVGDIENKKLRNKCLRAKNVILSKCIELFKSNLKRAAFEIKYYSDLEEKIEKLIDESKPVKMVDQINYHIAQMHWGTINGSANLDETVYDVFFPVVDDTNVDKGYHVNNIWLFEHRKIIANRCWKNSSSNKCPDVSYGADQAGNSPFNYHWYQKELKSIDIGARVGNKLFVTMRDQVPIEFFLGDDNNRDKVYGSHAVLQDYKIFHAGQNGNDLSFYLAFKQVLTNYDLTRSDYDADKFLVGWGKVRLLMLENACVYHDELSSKIEPTMDVDRFEYHKNNILDKYQAFKSEKSNIKKMHDELKNSIARKNKSAKLLKSYQNAISWRLRKIATFVINKPTDKKGLDAYNKLMKDKEKLLNIGKFMAEYTSVFENYIFNNADAQKELFGKNYKIFKKYYLSVKYYEKKFKDELQQFFGYVITTSAIGVLYTRSLGPLIRFLKSGKEMLDEFKDDDSVKNKYLGYHSYGIMFYYKTDKSYKMMVRQYYSHMYRIEEVLSGTSYPADEKIELGQTGTNGYSAGPHLHINTVWSHGWDRETWEEITSNTPHPQPEYPEKEKDRVWISMSPALLLPVI